MNNTFIKIGKRIIRLESINFTYYSTLDERLTGKDYAKLEIFFTGEKERVSLYNEEAEQMFALLDGMALNITPSED